MVTSSIVDVDLGALPSVTDLLRVLEAQTFVSLPWITGVIAVLLVLSLYAPSQLSEFPLITEKSFWDISGRKAKESFTVDARGVVERGFKQVGASKPFRVISELGEMLIMPPSLAHDVRNDEKLSFAEYMKESTCADLPGFEPFDEATRSTLLNDMVKTKLTQSLSKVTRPLSDEAARACEDIFSNSKEWHEVALKDAILDLVARISARVFLGDEAISRNPAWLRITKNYTVDSFLAAHALRTYPRFLRPLMHWFLPGAQKVRAQLREAEAIIAPVISRRRAERAAADGGGSGSMAERADSIEWLEQMAREKRLEYRAAALQLNLAISAIHTTADLLAQTMYELLQHPEAMPPLREEIVAVVADQGLKHSSLYNLKLMDSVIKEAQRLKPAMSVNMNRVATAATRLLDGTLIPRGTKLGVSSHALWDATIHPAPARFDPARFLRLRQRPGEENAWQLTTTRPEHIAFGHGRHACPGRFLAAAEIKVALCHLLLGWEWWMDPAAPAPRAVANGIMLDADPTVKVLLRRRQAEVEL